MTLWYEKNLRRILVDQHIPDWNERSFSQFDPERYADMMVKAHVNCAEIYAGNSLGICLFPTEKGYAHKQLKGRDFFGETVAACRRRGLAVQAYFSFWASMPYRLHPEWRTVRPGIQAPDDLEHSRWGICCMNSGFADYFLAELDELNSRYDVSGFWIDMFGWFSILCQCPNCRRRYREDMGEELPTVIDWNNPAFTRYAEWRARCMGDYAQKITDTIHQRTPERTVNIQTASFLNGWGGGVNEDFIRASQYLAGDFVGDSMEQSYVCKVFSALSPHRPMEFMTPRCEDLSFHTTERAPENLLMRAYAALANQSSFTLIDAIDPAGTLDERFYDHAQKVNDAYAVYESYVLPDSRPLADVAVYHSFASRVNTECGKVDFTQSANAAFGQRATSRNVARTLSSEHLLFTFTANMLAEDLRKYPVIYLAFGNRLTAAECAELEAYVAQGGRLYASQAASLYDPQNGLRDDFALAKLFGVHYRGQTGRRSYIAPTEGSSLLDGIATADYPLMVESPQCLLAADADTQVEGTLVLPIGPAQDPNVFSSGISDPPMLPQGTPALVRHRYGKGEVIYCAGRIEEIQYDYHRRALAKMLKELRGTPLVETDAPKTTEITVFEQPSRRRLVVSLLNLPADLPCQPLYNLHVRLNLPAGMRPQQLLQAPAETPFPCRIDGQSMEFIVPELREFAMFLVPLEN